ETPEQRDVVLERNVGAPAATAAATAATTTEPTAATTASADAGAPAGRRHAGAAARANIQSTAAARGRACSTAAAHSSHSAAATRGTRTTHGTGTAAWSIAAGPQHFIPGASTKIRPVLNVAAVTRVLLAHVGVVVSNALAMRRIVIPVLDPRAAVDVDVAAG